MKRLAQGALAALAALAAASPADAYVTEQSKWNPATLPITYRVNSSTIPASLGAAAGVAAVDAGFTTWSNAVCGTAWRASNAGNSTLARIGQGDSERTILWVSGSWPAELGDVNSVIGVTTPVWRSGGYFFDADIQFNNVGFRWNTTGSSGYVDAQSIATHEEGHFLGLDHTTVRGAIMYPSYSGGTIRNLASDDANGVCALYPGTGPRDGGVVPPVDASVPTDPCNAFTDCGSCTAQSACGYCSGTGRCSSGSSAGPTGGSCTGTWAWQPTTCRTITPPADSGTTTDPCNAYTDCASCTAQAACGFCASTNRCSSGSSTGPAGSACTGVWAWQPATCGSITPTTDAGSAGGDVGTPCTSGATCASRLCVATTAGATMGFCSQSCSTSDPCTCPDAYRCVMGGTLSVCVPGANACYAGSDAGTNPGPDSGTNPDPDSGTNPGPDGSTNPGVDGGTTRDGAAGEGGVVRPGENANGCGCSTPGHAPARGTHAVLVALGAMAVVLRRRGKR